MAVRITNKTPYLLELPSPIGGQLPPHARRDFDFVAFDDVLNESRLAQLIAAGKIDVVSLDVLEGTLLEDSIISVGVLVGQAGYLSGNRTIAPTDASGSTGSFATATFAGIYQTLPSGIAVSGSVSAIFDTGLSPSAGEPATLSWINSGNLRNDSPPSGFGHFQTRVGTIFSTEDYADSGTCLIILHPQPPVQIA